MTVDTRLEELAPNLEHSTERVALIRSQVLARAAALDHAPRRRPQQRPGRRWMVGGVVAAAAASALVVGPTLIPDSDPFAANALTPLAQAAERTEVPPLSNGRVLHRTTEYRQTDTTSGKVTNMRWEEWTLENGTFYRQTTVDGKIGPVEYWNTPSASDFTPREIAALPTDPARLLEAVKDSPQATSNIGGDPRAVQSLLGTIIYGGYAPTKVWAAAIEAYGSFDNVQVRIDDAKNVTYVTEVAKGGPLTMRFDSTTGKLLGYDSTSPEDGGRTETMTVLLSKVEDGVPARITDAAKPSGS
jgi:hypothetical protein